MLYCPYHKSKLLCGVQPVPRSELSLCDATRRVASSPATDGSNAKKARSRSVVSITATSGSAVKPVSAWCTKSQGWNQFARVPPQLCIVLFLQALLVAGSFTTQPQPVRPSFGSVPQTQSTFFHTCIRVCSQCRCRPSWNCRRQRRMHEALLIICVQTWTKSSAAGGVSGAAAGAAATGGGGPLCRGVVEPRPLGQPAGPHAAVLAPLAQQPQPGAR